MADNHIFPFLWMRGESEEVLRREMEKIHDCGIHAVCVEARPHPDFCGPGWWRDMDIIIDEAEKRDMQIWILDDKHFPTGYANDLIKTKYPERRKIYLNYSSADIFGASKVQEINVKQMCRPNIMFWQLGDPIDREERAKNELYAVVAARAAEGKILGEEMIDLTKDVRDGRLRFRLPEGQWKLCVIYKTRTDGNDPACINMLDAVSTSTQIEGVYEPHFEHYGDKFGKIILGFFSDEPQFGNVPGFGADCSPVVGDPKQPMPWSDEMESCLKELYGDDLASNLLYFWHNTKEEECAPKFRYNYMNLASMLYEKNFSCMLGAWCKAHGVEYIGHVVEDNGNHARLGAGPGHYFRAMTGQHMAGIDCIGGQVVYGAPTANRKDIINGDGEFYMYALGKMGASCGHLDPQKKNRTMCELFGAYGWKFGVRDQKYVLDHLLSRGINYLVPHAFSMAEYPDMDCPPHFYAGGHNPEYPYFRELMKYADRMCDRLSGGVHVPEVAVLYDAEAEWSGSCMAMQSVCRELLRSQIEFDIVSTDMLSRQKDRYRTEVKNSRLVVNGLEFAALIVPFTERITVELASFIEENPTVDVIFTDSLPAALVNSEDMSVPSAVMSKKVTALGSLAEYVRKAGLCKINVTPAFGELAVYHYYKGGSHTYMLLNESSCETFDGVITLPAEGELAVFDELRGTCEKLETEEKGALVSFRLVLEPAQSVIVAGAKEAVEELPSYEPLKDKVEAMDDSLDLSSDWLVSRIRAIDYPEFPADEEMKTLIPISDLDPNFAGHIRYTKCFDLKALPACAVISFENVSEVMKLTVNGSEAGVILQPPYRCEITDLLREGRNELIVEVATTPDRDQANYPAAPFIMKYESQELTGMYGKVMILLN